MMEVDIKELEALFKQTADDDLAVATQASRELAIALTLPLNQGVLYGSTLEGIYEQDDIGDDAPAMYPMDLLSPSSVDQHIAYTVPAAGRIPERAVSGDEVTVPTFEIASSIDWNLKYAKRARWNILKRGLQVMEASFTRKTNNDGWHTILASAEARNIVIYDDAATAGLFTKRLVSLLARSMRRNAGGNSTSVSRGRLTDLYLSPEAIDDIRSWDLTQIDDLTRREILMSGDGKPMGGIFGVRFHDLDELGVGQEYQNYFANTLGGTMGGSKVEIVIGLDLEKNDSFVQPVRQRLQVFEDMAMHRHRRQGFYGWIEHGFTVLTQRRCILGAL